MNKWHAVLHVLYQKKQWTMPLFIHCSGAHLQNCWSYTRYSSWIQHIATSNGTFGHLRGKPQESNHLSRSKGVIDEKEKSLVKGRLAHRAVVVGRRFFLARWDHSWALKFQQERMDVTKWGGKMFQMGEQFGPGVDYDLPLALVNKPLLGHRQPGLCLLLPFHGGVE